MELSRKLELLNQELTIENNILKDKLKEKEEQIKNLEDEKLNIRKELDSIIYSRSYKAIQKIKKIIKK